jgi:hypothetical protein
VTKELHLVAKMIRALGRLTSLVRLMDFRRASNRLIALASVIVSGSALGYGLYEGRSLLEAVARAVQLGLGVFLAWAIARELDPDRPESAAAATLIGAVLLFTGSPRLGGVLAVLLVMRIVLRSPGRPPTVVDLVFLVALAAYNLPTPLGLPAAVALGIALVADSRLPEPAPAHVAMAGVVITLGVIAGGIYFGSFRIDWAEPTGWEWAFLALVGLALATLRVPAPAATDDRRAPLSRSRLVWATWLGVSAGVATVVFTGGTAVPKLSPVWAALIAVAFSRRIAIGSRASGHETHK